MKENKKRLRGYVVSDKPLKSIIVEVKRTKLHLLYKKRINWSKKYMAHDDEDKAKVGNYVEIAESKPYSKRKCFELIKVIGS